MSHAIVLTGAGVAVGALLRGWSLRDGHPTLRSGLCRADPLTYVLVAGLLAAVSMVASALPAVRPARIDPMLVFRDQ